MKRFLSLFLGLLLVCQCQMGSCASQWLKLQIDGSESPSDIDALNQVNNEAQDRLLYLTRVNCTVIPDTSSQVEVLPGTVSIPNSAGSIVQYRKNTSSVTVTTSNLDTGASFSNDTYYYVYANGDTDATTFTITISTSSSSPSGITYYRKIGWFYVNSSGNIAEVGNIKEGAVDNIVQVTGTDDISTTAVAFTNMTDMEINFVSNGSPVYVIFQAPIYIRDGGFWLQIDIDGIAKTQTRHYHHDGSTGNEVTVTPAMIHYLDTTLAAGEHTIKIQWYQIAGPAYQYGATEGYRILIVEEK